MQWTAQEDRQTRPVRELTDQTRLAVDEYLRLTGRKLGQFLFAGRGDGLRGLATGQYTRRVHDSGARSGLDLTKSAPIYGRTGKIESTVRYLGVEVDDAIEITEKIDI